MAPELRKCKKRRLYCVKGGGKVRGLDKNQAVLDVAMSIISKEKRSLGGRRVTINDIPSENQEIKRGGLKEGPRHRRRKRV